MVFLTPGHFNIMVWSVNLATDPLGLPYETLKRNSCKRY
jgi:hypothetical protein